MQATSLVQEQYPVRIRQGLFVGFLIATALMIQSIAAFAHGAPETFADLVEEVSPAVVNITTTTVIDLSDSDDLPIVPEGSPFEDFFRDFEDRQQERNRSRKSQALGSGFFISEDGYVVTNNHVIAGADEILVAFADGQATTATVVGSDPETDLAVIRVQVRGLTAIPMGSSDDLEVGDLVLAIGNPFGIGQTVSSGIISAKGRAGISSLYDDFLQTDAAINPGNSGGALIDVAGRLVGINTLIFSRSGGAEGIGFAVPVKLAMSILEEIVATGRVTRGYLGAALANNRGAGMGLEVAGVEPGGPAHAAGLLPGDLILAIDGRPAASSTMVTRQIARTAPGSMLSLTIQRNDKQLVLVATAGTRPPRE